MPAMDASHAEQRMRKLRSTGTNESCQTQYFTGVNRKTDIAEFPLDDSGRQAAVLFLAALCSRVFNALLESLASHQLGESRLRHALGWIDANQLPITYDCNSCSNLQHFCQPMADKDYGNTLRRQGGYQRQQTVCFRSVSAKQSAHP